MYSIYRFARDPPKVATILQFRESLIDDSFWGFLEESADS